MNKFTSLLKKSIPLVLVIISIPLALYLLDSGKMEQPAWKKDNKKRQRIVRVVDLTKGSVIPKWNSSGLVKANESVNILAEVSGKIAEVNPIARPGALLDRGAWLAKVDNIDYALALRTQQSQLVQAQASLELELADQILAKEELALLEGVDQNSLQTTLVLREPQLLMAQAKLDIAKTNVEKAEIALQRTNVVMPFKGKIVSKSVGRGSRVGQNSNLFKIVNVDTFWVEVKIPRTFLGLFDSNHDAILTQPKLWGEDVTRTAKFVSVLPELDSRDRQVKVLLAIDNPLSLNANNSVDVSNPPIFINDFLSIELQGNEITDAWVIKSNLLQPGDFIWVVDKGNTLQKRSVDVLFKGRESIYIKAGFIEGDRALSEKPGIVSVGLPVKAIDINMPRKVKPISKDENEVLDKKEQKRLQRGKL
ncbi:HlyD family efflux transporter periplasmic adaptor subunit [Thalassotalea psychrophila]|uniref:HlyD family efflux transporter periplasmic adaptor subunit n=1 Tax=Thalassotalea psychrophila TaxID=3065647 RepID=A0ABY9TZE0_9GAMM|nr:HlyD family efflux transporter periplasmic adaptor subunit [Colwelliaceae bacterium SQ149]